MICFADENSPAPAVGGGWGILVSLFIIYIEFITLYIEATFVLFVDIFFQKADCTLDIVNCKRTENLIKIKSISLG